MAWLGRGELPQGTVRWVSLAMWLLAVAAAVVLLIRTESILRQPVNLFPGYYTAAKLIQNNEDIARFYDDDWYIMRVSEFIPGSIEIYYANTPLMAFFFRPLAEISYDGARRVFAILSFAALAAAAYLMSAELGIKGAWRAAAFFAVFAAPPSLTNVAFGQVYAILLLIFVLIWVAWRRGAEGLGGMLFGIVLAFKTAGLFFLPLIVLEKRWRALAAAGGTVGVLTLVTFPYVGRGGWEAYFERAGGLVGSPRMAFSGYLSVTGFARNLFRYDGEANLDPYFDAPALSFGIEAVAFLIIGGFATKLALTTKDRDIIFALFLMLTLILVPVVAYTHYCLAFLPACIIFSRLRERMMSPLGVWFLVGGILSFGPGVDRARALVEWGGPVFFYARLSGLMILMCLLIVLGVKNEWDAARPDPAPVSKA